MGIKDADKVIEEWLAKIAPQAFFYKLPKGVALSLVVQDLSAMLVSAFMSNRCRTGEDFVQLLMRPVERFASAETPSSNADAKAKREELFLSSDSEGDEGGDLVSLLERIDWKDGCLKHRYNVESYPSDEDFEKLRMEEHDRLDVQITPHARLILTRDSHTYMPANRDMLHEERYRVTENERDQPISTNEMEFFKIAIRVDRPMPGMSVTGEPQENLSLMRARANRTPTVREAYQNFGPWMIAERLKEIGSEIAGLRDRQPTSKRPEDQRTVVVDAVLESFPEDYASKELWQLPARWGHGHHKIHRFRMDGTAHETTEPIRIGEADLKMIWYALNAAPDGAQVLICSNDSDILFILLANAHRFRDKQGRWIRTLFLDMNTPNMKKERYQRRFVCINILADFLESKRAENPMAGIPYPLQVLTVMALTVGSDYTQNPYGIGAKKVLELFTQLCVTHKAELFEMVRLGRVVVNDDMTTPESFQFHESVSDVQLVLFDTSTYDVFMRRLFQLRLTQKTIKDNKLVPGNLMSWTKLRHLLKTQDSSKKDPEKYELPSDAELLGNHRRLMWTLHYWMNGHLNWGDFPAADLDDPSTGRSIWGWCRTRRSITAGDGQDRYINRDHVQWTTESLVAHNTTYERTLTKEKSIQNGERNDGFVCCKNNNLVSFDEIWPLFIGEGLVRSLKKCYHIHTPRWNV